MKEERTADEDEATPTVSSLLIALLEIERSAAGSKPPPIKATIEVTGFWGPDGFKGFLVGAHDDRPVSTSLTNAAKIQLGRVGAAIRATAKTKEEELGGLLARAERIEKLAR